MKNTHLANWLEQSMDKIASKAGETGLVLCESIIRAATTGRAKMLESVLDDMVCDAVAKGLQVEDLLSNLYILKDAINDRLDEEIDPAIAWNMHLSLESIFKAAILFTASSYTAQTQNSKNKKNKKRKNKKSKKTPETEQQLYDYAAKLARANRELERLERTKTDFISVAAHELKTPLAVLVGYAKFTPEERTQILAKNADTVFGGIARATNRLEMIVNNLLDISALETDLLVIKRSSVNLKHLVSKIIAQAEVEAEARQHTYVIQVAHDFPKVIIDAKRLHQALDQLINNAIKYTPNGGKITVDVSLDERSEKPNKALRIAVSDTGIGIAPEDRDIIFEKFYRVGETNLHSSGTVKFKGAGPGLGLSLAKGIIEALNGRIWAESQGYDEVNCPGSVFHLCIPVEVGKG